MAMRNLIILLFLTSFYGCTNGQTQSEIPFIAIDHTPIAIKNIDRVKKTLSDSLGFTIKEGNEHSGIKNCFVKFQDGTYLEFITPVDSLPDIGKYYANFLKKREGGTSLAISINNADTITRFLKDKNIQFEIDSNKIWKTIEPKNYDLFFIDYNDKNWKDSKTNTTHLNNALSLKTTYIIENKQNKYEEKYKQLGFIESEKATILDASYKTFLVGKSSICILNTSSTKKIISKFNKQNFSGICGFQIKVSSLKQLKSKLTRSKNVMYEKGKVIYFFPENNFFFEFTEKL